MFFHRRFEERTQRKLRKVHKETLHMAVPFSGFCDVEGWCYRTERRDLASSGAETVAPFRATFRLYRFLNRRLLLLKPFDNLADIAVTHGDTGVGGTVVDGAFVAFGEGGAGETYCGNVAVEFVLCGRCEQIFHGTVENL